MLPDTLKKRIEHKAGELHISLGELIRIATERFLEKDSRRWNDDPLVKGDYVIDRPAPVEVSENSDTYLYGANR